MTDKTIGRIAAGIAALAVAFSIIFVADLLGLIPTGPFWENLFAGVLAGLVVLVVVGLFLPLYLRILFAPKVELAPDQEFELTRYLDGRLKGVMRLIIRNEGSKTVQAFYWHLIVPRKLNPVVQDLRGRIIGARRIGEFDYIHGLVDDQPVFPKTTLELPIRVSLDTSDFRSGWNIKYALSTEHGHFPKEMELHRQMDASALADCAEFGIRAVVEGGAEEQEERGAEVRCEEMGAETEPVEEEQPETVAMNL